EREEELGAGRPRGRGLPAHAGHDGPRQRGAADVRGMAHDDRGSPLPEQARQADLGQARAGREGRVRARGRGVRGRSQPAALRVQAAGAGHRAPRRPDRRARGGEEVTSVLPEIDAPVAVATGGLVAEGLVRYYGKFRVVQGVSLNVRRGEVVGLLGPNGAGKSTTFHMIVGLLRPNEGSISLDGRDITAEPVYRRARLGLGYLAQEPSIFRKLTVRENVLA